MTRTATAPLDAIQGDRVGTAEPRLRCSDGSVVPLAVARWLDGPDPVEDAILDHARPPVLDVGCGAGRLVLAAARRGWPALGVETAPSAVQLGRTRGASILERSIFGPIPAAGRWATALLFDGTIGIGGDPEALLRRVRALLRPGGRALVEVEGPGSATRRLSARIEAGRHRGIWFPWARVGADGIGGCALAAHVLLEQVRREDERWFALLVRP